MTHWLLVNGALEWIILFGVLFILMLALGTKR